MKNLILMISVIALLNSCEKNDGKQTHVENRKPDTLVAGYSKNPIEIKENVDYCYLSVIAKDSMFLSYKINNGKVSGKLKYKNFEKDSSSGDITGTISGDTLKVNYKFNSEGVTSEREIYFLQDSGILLEGTGNYSNNNSSKLTYESPKAVKYSSANRLNPVDCKSIK